MNLFSRLGEALRTDNLHCLIIGGHAVGAHGFARFTKDLDVLISRAEREKWLAVLQKDGYAVEHDGGNFLQLASQAMEATPVDFMLVNERTFEKMLEDSKRTQIENLPFQIPSLGHLLALKVHALKHGPSRRGLKDFMDVLNLVEVNHVDVRSDKFRSMCDKYGDKRIYERIIDFGQR